METFLRTTGALNDETRIKILRFIAQNDEVCVCKIEEAFDMIQSRISRHLKILKDAGFLSVDRRGKWAYYAIQKTLDPFQKAALASIKTLDIALPQPCVTCTPK
jgi:ArsR family transcriptional regulator